jgi:hypothetical protein
MSKHSDNLSSKQEYILELQAVLDADKYWNYSDDHKYYMKMANISLEVTKLKADLSEYSKGHSSTF